MKRSAVAVAVGAVWGLYVWVAARRDPAFVSDFDQLWWAVRILRDGGDPYALIGPGRAYDYLFRFYYPLTAALVAWPLGWIDLIWARVLWVAVPTGALCYLVTRDGYSRLPMFLSGAMFANALTAQWGPLLMCGLYLPWLGGIVAGKPNIGAAVVAGQRGWRGLTMTAGGALGLLLVSLLISPRWPLSWLAAVRTADHFVPLVMRPGGVLLLLAAIRWREPSARLLLVLALVPHTSTTYDTLLLFAACRTFRQSLTLALLTHLGLMVAFFGAPDGPFAAHVANSAAALLVLVYLPALWLILSNGEAVGRAQLSGDRVELA